MTRSVMVSLTVISDDPHHITRAHEAMSRLATGLALDGIESDLMAGPDLYEHEHDDEEAA